MSALNLMCDVISGDLTWRMSLINAGEFIQMIAANMGTEIMDSKKLGMEVSIHLQDCVTFRRLPALWCFPLENGKHIFVREMIQN